MKAIVKSCPGPGNMMCVDVERPVPGPNEALIKVRACGICGSDLHIYQGEVECKTPLIIGHEFSGEVAELGPGVDGWSVGDRVVSELHAGVCGNCYYCENGMKHLCQSKTAVGWGVDGGFAEYVRVPAWLLHAVPDGLPVELAALAEPTAIAVYSILERSELREGDRVAVVGAGPLGLLSAIVCKHAGASWVGLIGRSSSGTLRLDTARQLGLDAVIDSTTEDTGAIVNEATHGVGADLVIEAGGNDESIDLSLRLVRRAGTITALGLSSHDKVNWAWNEAMRKVCRVVFSWSSTRSSWDRSLEILQSSRDLVKLLVTHQLPLQEWETGFRLLRDRRAIKCLLVP